MAQEGSIDVREIIEVEQLEERRRLDQVSAAIRAGERGRDTCDKCNRPVPPENNLINLLSEMGDYLAPMFATPRHLLPVIEEGVAICEGSPSRAQYLPDQPHDTRLSYQYNPDNERLFRDAYDRMLRRVATEKAAMN